MHRFVVNRCDILTGAALGDDVAGAALAATALGSDPQLKLNLVKRHTGMCVARNLTVRNTVAYTNDHGGKQ